MKTQIKRLGSPKLDMDSPTLFPSADPELDSAFQSSKLQPEMVDDKQVHSKFGRIYAGESFSCLLTVFNLESKHPITDIDLSVRFDCENHRDRSKVILKQRVKEIRRGGYITFILKFDDVIADRYVIEVNSSYKCKLFDDYARKQ